MAVLSKEEMMIAVQTIIGDSTSDEAIAFIENLTDTLDAQSGGNGDSEDWKTKYEDLDKSWKQKYRDRFFKGEENQEGTHQQEQEQEQGSDEPETFNDLFTVKE